MKEMPESRLHRFTLCLIYRTKNVVCRLTRYVGCARVFIYMNDVKRKRTSQNSRSTPHRNVFHWHPKYLRIVLQCYRIDM